MTTEAEEIETVIAELSDDATRMTRISLEGPVCIVRIDYLKRALSHISRLEEDVRVARQWVNDLQAGMYVNCVYCGHRYGPGETTPVTMADALKAHIEQCPKHPLSKALEDLRVARKVLKDSTESLFRAYEVLDANEPSEARLAHEAATRSRNALSSLSQKEEGR